MADLKMPVPLVGAAYYDAADVPKITAALEKLTSRHGDAIERVAALTRVPADLLRATSFIESKGNARIISSAGAVGLTQNKPLTAATTLYIEARGDRNKGLAAGRLSAEERTLVVRHIGEQGMRRIEACKNFGDVGQLSPPPITVAHLQDPEFNLLCGALALGQAIDLYQQDGVVRFDLVIAHYGRGRGAMAKVPAAARASVGGFMKWVRSARSWGEVAMAVVKYAGVNGLLDIQRRAA